MATPAKGKAPTAEAGWMPRMQDIPKMEMTNIEMPKMEMPSWMCMFALPGMSLGESTAAESSTRRRAATAQVPSGEQEMDQLVSGPAAKVADALQLEHDPAAKVEEKKEPWQKRLLPLR
jgi:hypothetical protein